MDSGPRDRSRPDRIRRPIGRHASCTGKTVWEDSPTRRKEKQMIRINRGMNSPINCHYPLYYSTCTWRPTRAPTWPRGLPATWPHPVRLLRERHGCCHVVSVPRRNPGCSRAPCHPSPCASSAIASPRQHLQVIKTLFRDFINRK